MLCAIIFMFRELKYTLRLSAPITAGLLGQGLFGVIDTVMIGNFLGENALAAATLGNNVNWIPLVVAIGLCVAIPVLTAQARGAGTPEKIPGALRHGLLVALGFALLGAGTVCAFTLADGLAALGQPEQVAADAKNFCCLVALSLPAAAGFQAVKSFRDASGGQWVSLTWTLLGLVANVFLNWVLMTGALGFPCWGLEGAAAGTLLARVFQFFGIALHGRLSLELARGFTLRELRENLRIAVPSALHILFEAGLFIVSPFFMGWISEASIAANQVVITISSLVYMAPLGVSQALSIRVGEAFGRNDLARVRVIFAGAVLFTFAVMCVAGAGVLAFLDEIPAAFNLGAEASDIARSILIVAVAYMLFDAFQTVASGALRGLGDVRVIAVGAFVSYWIIGCPTALILAFPLGLHGVGVWIGLASGLASIAVILGVRMRKNLARERS
ncbi:MAG: MATE family efflux transporter [Candidatus Spyradosoma sp.]